MSKLKFLRKISNSEKHLIDYANLKDNLFPHQDLKTNKNSIIKIINFKDKGLPILFPPGLVFFNYEKQSQLILDKTIIMKKIFSTNNYKYLPFQNFIIHGDNYFTKVKVKKKYHNIIKKITAFNKSSLNKIKKVNNKFKNTCAFQTRNIPHLGHEKIIESLLNKFDHVVINPLIGPKKEGDAKFEILEKAYKYIIDNKFKNKVSYIPIIANMFYAGPREAIHHANIRKNLGFKNFVIGRDHAGAFNNYDPMGAYRLVTQHKKVIKIHIERLTGAYYCQDCDIIRVDFNCKHNNFKNISGTEFRKKLKMKKMFIYADNKLQHKLHKIKNKIFV